MRPLTDHTPKPLLEAGGKPLIVWHIERLHAAGFRGAVALLLVFLCWALLRYASKNAQQHAYRIKEFERDDKEVLAFLVTYLLPFLSTDKMGFAGDWLTGAYVLLIIFLVIAHAGAFHFNPVMGLLGYHFYSVKNQDGVSHLLISRAELCRPGQEVQTVRLAQNIYLHTGAANAQ